MRHTRPRICGIAALAGIWLRATEMEISAALLALVAREELYILYLFIDISDGHLHWCPQTSIHQPVLLVHTASTQTKSVTIYH